MVKKFKSLSIFYRIYFSVLLIFVILLIFGSVTLSCAISQYNKGLPETVSEEFFNQTFLNLDTDKIIEMSGIEPSEFETEDDIKKYICENICENLSYTSISSEVTGKQYIVKSGDFKVASFTLNADEKGDYYPESITLHLSKNTNNVFRILSNSSLYINGIPVSDAYITERTPHISSSILPEGVPKLEWLTYEIRNLTAEPSVMVIDRNGQNPTLICGDDGIPTESILYDTQENEVVQRVLSGARQYAICMQQDAPKSSVYPYFEKGTELYESFRTVENSFVWDHSGYEILDEQVSEYMRYDENTVSMRISFTHVLKKYGYQDYMDLTDITYYARNIDGKYMIFARHNNT